MEIIYKNGNLLDATTDIIAHQVNCQGVMGAGVAKQIRDKWPIVFEEYQKLCNGIVNDGDFYVDVPESILGVCQFVYVEKGSKLKIIANLFGQDQYGRDKRYTNYEAIYKALNNLANMINDNVKSLAIPYGMSCGLAGGNWDVILAMINSVFKNTDITIEIWKYAV